MDQADRTRRPDDPNVDEEMERDTEIRRDTQVRGSLGIPPSGGDAPDDEAAGERDDEMDESESER